MFASIIANLDAPIPEHKHRQACIGFSGSQIFVDHLTPIESAAACREQAEDRLVLGGTDDALMNEWFRFRSLLALGVHV